MTSSEEVVVVKFGRELATICKKTNMTCKHLHDFIDYIDATIDYIIEDYPEIDDAYVHLPNDNYSCRIDVTLVDGTEMRISLGIETHYAVTGDIKVY